jgi:hypothetical protein
LPAVFFAAGLERQEQNSAQTQSGKAATKGNDHGFRGFHGWERKKRHLEGGQQSFLSVKSEIRGILSRPPRPNQRLRLIAEAGIFCLEGAGGQESVVNDAANNADGGELLEQVSVFVRVQRHNGQPLPDVGDEKNPLVAADAMFAGHPGQRGINLQETMRSAANILFGEPDEEIQTGGMMRMVAVKNRHQNRGIQTC